MSAVGGAAASTSTEKQDDRRSAVERQTEAYRPYRDALNGFMSAAAIAMLLYGLLALGHRNRSTRWRWFAIDLMVQAISIKIASDLIPHGIAVPGQNQMDAGVGVMLMALLVLILIGDMTGLSSKSGLWFVVDGAELALLLAVLIKYLVGVVA